MSSPRFVLDAFPMVVCIAPKHFDETGVREIIEGYERLFVRGDRYALVTMLPRGGETPSAAMRSKITTWANEPRVRDATAKLCVGSAIVVANPIARGALTAIYWLWQPPSPQNVVANPDEGIRWGLERLAATSTPVPLGTSTTRDLLLPIVRDA